MSAAVQITWGLALCVMILGPVALATWFWRRFGVNPRAFLLGALVFFVSQIVLRTPILALVQRQLGDSVSQGTPLILYLLGLAFSAGLFESCGRWAGYRWLFRPRLPYDWAHAVAYGIGHGGFESAVYVGVLSALSFVQGMALTAMTPDQLASSVSGDALTQALQAREMFAQMTWDQPLLAAVERIGTVPFHMAISLVVLQVFARRQLIYLLYAILIHGLADSTAVLLNYVLKAPNWVTELSVLAWGAAGVWYIVHCYRQEQRPLLATPEAG